MRVTRVYHGGRDTQHRGRERALVEHGVDVTLVVPSHWPDANGGDGLVSESFRVVELPIRRIGDVNRHAYTDLAGLRRTLEEIEPEIVDIHEEPFSLAGRQWCRVTPPALPIVMYTAQNIDKRYPPPFCCYERAAGQRVAAFYPCSQQAAAVLRGKGFSGEIDVIGLGFDDAVYRPGRQSLDQEEIVMVLAGRLVPEKGVLDAVHVLAHVNTVRPARLLLRGSGPEGQRACELAAVLGVSDRVDVGGWGDARDLAAAYAAAHVVLVPSHRTATWVEQFGRVIVEAQACGAVVAGYATGSIAEIGGSSAALAQIPLPRELARRVLEVVESADEWERRRAEGIRAAAERTWTAVAQRQVELYQRVALGQASRVALPRSPARRRAMARSEFGSTADTTAGMRPFALPWLRRAGPVSALLAHVLDRTAEIVARLPRLRHIAGR